MVLEEATSGNDAGFSDSGASSDYNFETGDTPQGTEVTEQWRINLGALPKPLGLFGPTTWDTPSRIDLLKKSMAESRAILGRPFTQDEIDALSFKFAKSVTIASYAYPTGIIAGALWTYNGRQSFKFPFYNPGGKEWFDPNKFSVFRGSQARAAWHGLRFTAYTGFAAFLAMFFWGSVASTTDIAGTVTDPRLKDFREALKAKMKERQGDVAQRPPAQRSPVDSAPGRMDSQAVKAGSVWERAREQKASRSTTTSDDDMSPTGGAFMDDMASDDSDGGLLSDSQMQMNERREQYESRAAERTSNAAAQSTERQQRAPQRQSDQGRRDSGTATGGVWERLRKEAEARGQGGGVQKEQRQGSTVGDSFSFSQREEDRQLAQSEAQKEFDARVERERQGGSFDEGRSRKW